MQNGEKAENLMWIYLQVKILELRFFSQQKVQYSFVWGERINAFEVYWFSRGLQRKKMIKKNQQKADF